MENGRRPYRMTGRADAVEQTRVNILAATYQLWLERPYEQVTLDAVAGVAGVTRQTILRHFGSKDELVVAVVDWQRPIEEAAREAEPDEAATALDRLVDRYEVMGDANVRVLELEGRIDAIDHVLGEARASHRAWVERTFAGSLPRRGTRVRDDAVLALYAATDVTVWKLLRRDFGRSRRDTEATMLRLVEGVLSTLQPARKEPR